MLASSGCVGVVAATSFFGPAETTGNVLVALLGGLIGAGVLLAAYFVGVALVGAGLGALLVNVIWTQIEGDPHPAIVILFSVAGAVVATWLQRYVIIIATAFAGAWTLLIGGLALMGDGGYLEVLGLNDHTLSIRYQGACGSCPSSLTGTLMAIEGMLKQEVDPDLEVIAV